MLDDGSNWEPEPFQLAVVEDLFAGSDELWLVVPEGNGKTTLTSGVALYHADYTAGANVVVGASSRDQCEVLHNQAGGFVRRTPGLERRFRVFDGYRRIKALRTDGRVQVFAADDRTGDGVIPTLALLDELHRHRDMRLYRTWRGKLAKRGGQLLAISTAGEPGSEFEEIRSKMRTEAATVARDGAFTRAVDGAFVLHDWAVPAEGDPENMEEVKAANPLPTITPETLARKRASKTMSKAHWRRFVCNQATRDGMAAIDESEWETAGTDDVIPPSERIWVGLDLGWKWDCTAWAPLWMREPEYRLLGKPAILTPPRDGTSLRPDDVKQAFRAIYERNPVDTVVMDPAAGGEEIAAWLRDNFTGIRVVEYPHTNTPMALACERFMEALREGWLHHPRDPEFTRHVLNATQRLLPDGRSRFDRPSASRAAPMQERRVWDALDAASMVHSVAVAEAQASLNPSDWYERNRIELL